MPRITDVSNMGVSPPRAARLPVAAPSAEGVGLSLARGAEADAALAADRLKEREASEAIQDRQDLAHANSLFLQGKAALDSTEPTREDYLKFPDEYRAKIKELRESVSRTLSGPVRQAFLDQSGVAAERGAALAGRAASAVEKDVGRADLSGVIETNLKAAVNADDEATGAGLLAAAKEAIETAELKGDVTAQEAGKARRELAERYALGRAEMLDPVARLEALKAGASTNDGLTTFAEVGRFVDFIPLNTRLALIRDAEREKANAEAEAERESREAHALDISNLKVGVGRGEKTYADVESAFAADLISGNERTALFLELDRQGAEQRKDAELAGRVASALRGEGFLDPGNADDRRGAEAFWKMNVAPIIAAQPEHRGPVIAEYSKALGIVPESVKGEIRGALRSGDVGAKAEAADVLDRLRVDNPAVLRDFSQADIALGLHIATLRRSGVPEARAVELAEEAAKVPEAERKARRARAQEENHGRENATFLRKASARGWFEKAAEIPDMLAGEFDALQALAFDRTGNLEASQEIALENLRNVWAVSTVGGAARWMKFAPERYGLTNFDIDENGEWMQGQLLADVRGVAGDVDEERIRVFADALTGREDRPSYAVMIEREDGVLEPVIAFEDGKLLRWRPDFSASPKARELANQAEERRREAERTLEGAKASRRQRIQSESAPAGFLARDKRGGAF